MKPGLLHFECFNEFRLSNNLKRRNIFLKNLSTLENELLKMNTWFLSTLKYEQKKPKILLYKQNKKHIKSLNSELYLKERADGR